MRAPVAIGDTFYAPLGCGHGSTWWDTGAQRLVDISMHHALEHICAQHDAIHALRDLTQRLAKVDGTWEEGYVDRRLTHRAYYDMVSPIVAQVAAEADIIVRGSLTP